MMNHLLAAARGHAQLTRADSAITRHGIIRSFDPVTYSATVEIQPEAVLTDFLPIASPWTGAGWGMVCPPTAGDLVDVHYIQDSPEAGYISQRFFSTTQAPPSPNASSGEFFLVHKSGSYLKFKNDGTVTLNSAGTLSLTAPTINLN
jgi:uncharacterized protein involved in type VI secretion and phage assembly